MQTLCRAFSSLNPKKLVQWRKLIGLINPEAKRLINGANESFPSGRWGYIFPTPQDPKTTA
jgi:hypothetical protein